MSQALSRYMNIVRSEGDGLMKVGDTVNHLRSYEHALTVCREECGCTFQEVLESKEAGLTQLYNHEG